MVAQKFYELEENSMNAVFNLRSNLSAFRELITLLTRHRQLTIEMARREILDRYAGQFFGLFWAFGHPIILMVVYVFIFSVIFKIKINGTIELPRDYTAYILSGLIPWIAFQDSMSRASMAVISSANLVKQVVFPVEVLPVKGVFATFFTEVVFLCGLIVYIGFRFQSLPWIYLLLPVLIIIQLLAMIGISFILSSVGVFFRDIKDFIQVFTTIGVYLMPTFYLPESVPDLFRRFLFLNPFSYYIWCYQDVFFYGRMEHPWAWAAAALMSVIVFVFGYRFFHKFEPLFGNVL